MKPETVRRVAAGEGVDRPPIGCYHNLTQPWLPTLCDCESPALILQDGSAPSFSIRSITGSPFRVMPRSSAPSLRESYRNESSAPQLSRHPLFTGLQESKKPGQLCPRKTAPAPARGCRGIPTGIRGSGFALNCSPISPCFSINRSNACRSTKFTWQGPEVSAENS